MGIEELLFDISDALRWPVLVLTVIALGFMIVEFGALGMELWQRRGRSRRKLEWVVHHSIQALNSGDVAAAQEAAAQAGTNGSMRDALRAIIGEAGPEAVVPAMLVLLMSDALVRRSVEPILEGQRSAVLSTSWSLPRAGM